MSITVETILKLPIMKEAKIISETGRHNTVQYVTVAEAPKIHFPNYNQGIFVLSTLSAYHESLEKINAFVEGLCQVNVAAIGIKLGRFIDSIDPSTAAIAEQYHVALVVLPPTVYFREVLSDVLSVITGNQKVLLDQINAMNEALLNSIVHNKSIQEILNLLCKKLDCYCCCIASPSEKMAESSSLSTDIDADAVYAAIQTFFGDPRYWESGYAQGHIYIYPCIVQDRLLAAVCIVSYHTEQNLVQPLAQSVVSGISIKLLERDLKDQAARGVVASLLDDILFSQRTDANLALERLASLNFTPCKNFLILVLTSPYIYQDLNWPHIVGNIQSVFLLHFQSVLAFKRGAECVVFLSYDADITSPMLCKRLDGCLSDLENIEKHNFFIGCSTVTQNLSMISECYRQAKKAIEFGQAVDKSVQIYLYIDYYEMGLISYGLASSEANLFAERIIDPILEYDKQTKSELWHTLETSSTSATLDQAAKDLHIHISTLRYRLQKIEQITSYNFFNQNDRIKMYLAYILHKVSKKGDT